MIGPESCDYLDTYENLMHCVPDRCRNCFRPHMVAVMLATKVERQETTADIAKITMMARVNGDYAACTGSTTDSTGFVSCGQLNGVVEDY